jgi:hypothetical protein
MELGQDMSPGSRRSLLSQRSRHSQRSQRSRLGQRILLLRLTVGEGICTILYSLANIPLISHGKRQCTDGRRWCRARQLWFGLRERSIELRQS